MHLVHLVVVLLLIVAGIYWSVTRAGSLVLSKLLLMMLLLGWLKPMRAVGIFLSIRHNKLTLRRGDLIKE